MYLTEYMCTRLLSALSHVSVFFSSNIPEFAKYIHKLPSLEKAVPTAKIKPSTVVSTRTTCSEEENVYVSIESLVSLLCLGISLSLCAPCCDDNVRSCVLGLTLIVFQSIGFS